MDNSRENILKLEEKSIWKSGNTPRNERKTSSGVTFWPEKVEAARKGGG